MVMNGTVTQHDPMTALWLLVDRLEQAWLPPYPDSDEFYGWVPMVTTTFIDVMMKIKAEIEAETHASGTNGRFLEVGCGIGSKLLLARFLGWGDVTGIELRPEYAEVARHLCPEADVFEADAFEWDGYGDFDLVFMNRPCIPDELERRLEERVLSLMTSGSYAFFGQPVVVGPEIRRV